MRDIIFFLSFGAVSSISERKDRKINVRFFANTWWIISIRESISLHQISISHDERIKCNMYKLLQNIPHSHSIHLFSFRGYITIKHPRDMCIGMANICRILPQNLFSFNWYWIYVLFTFHFDIIRLIGPKQSFVWVCVCVCRKVYYIWATLYHA